MSLLIEQRPSPAYNVGRPRRMRTLLLLEKWRLKNWLLRTIEMGSSERNFLETKVKRDLVKRM